VLLIISNYKGVLTQDSPDYSLSEAKAFAEARWKRCCGLIEESIENMGSDYSRKNPEKIRKELENLTETFPIAKKEEIVVLSAAYGRKCQSSDK
jgi:hypothetical protein